MKFHIYGYPRNPHGKPVFWGTSRGKQQRLTPVPTLNPNDLPLPESEQRKRAYGAKPPAHKR